MKRLAILAALALLEARSGRFWYVGANDGSAAVTYANDSVWVSVSSPWGPFAFHASTATMAEWADSAKATHFPNGNTARFKYYDTTIRDTITLQLTRESGDSAPPFQCMARVRTWSASIVFQGDSAQRFLALLRRAPEVVSAPPSPPPAGNPTTYFDFQVTRQALPTRESGRVWYPPPLSYARVSGEVLGQFVVDTTGLVDLSTFKILKSTDSWFTSAVIDALPRFRFVPAEVKGVKVRELVQQPYAFNLK